MKRGRKGDKDELRDCVLSLPEDKGTNKQQRIKETPKDGMREAFFFLQKSSFIAT